MKDSNDHIPLVIKARQGHQEAINQLTQIASQRLSQFVFRLTLQEELTQDIVQESLVDMLRFFPTLKHTERFWYWLYGMAYNKIGRHFQRQRIRQSVPLSQIQEESMTNGQDQTVADVISQELREIVGRSMQQIDPNHRAILTMRCYDQMSYAQISQLMNCSQFSARALFYRAKKALARRLAGYGLGKEALLTALVVFGKMTATSETAAAHMTITAASLQCGTGMALVCTLLSRTAALWFLGTLLTTGMLVGAMPQALLEHQPSASMVNDETSTIQDQQHWFYYPQGMDGPMLLRTQARTDDSQWHILQNAQGNFIWEGQTITFRNAHAILGPPCWTSSASQQAALRLDERAIDGTYASQILPRQNVQQEDFFQPDWPTHIRVVDQRDTMHQQGWTQVHLQGSLQGQLIEGTACIPFTYDALAQHQPWLRCRIGSDLTLTDTPQGAQFRPNPESRGIRLPAGTFLVGLNRPWRGLHCLDDLTCAARAQGLEAQVTRLTDRKATVEIDCDSVTLLYEIDVDDDLIRCLRWKQDHRQIGELHFEYIGTETSIPIPNLSRRENSTQSQVGLRWLFYLGKPQLADQF